MQPKFSKTKNKNESQDFFAYMSFQEGLGEKQMNELFQDKKEYAFVSSLEYFPYDKNEEMNPKIPIELRPLATALSDFYRFTKSQQFQVFQLLPFIDNNNFNQIKEKQQMAESIFKRIFGIGIMEIDFVKHNYKGI